MNTALTQLGGAFRRARIASQKTLKEVANLSGVSFGYVGRMERGTLPAPPSELALKRMCAAIGIPPEPLIALRSDWYREGSLEPTVIQSSDAARDELAGLGEQALRAADLAQRKRNIDAEIELTHTALDLFDRSGRFSEIGMAAYRLGSAHLSRTWGPLEGPMTGQVLADAKASLLNFDRATSAYSRVPELSIGDTQRMHDGLAQAGRLLERISDLNNASIGADPRIEFTEAQSLPVSFIELRLLHSSLVATVAKRNHLEGAYCFVAHSQTQTAPTEIRPANELPLRPGDESGSRSSRQWSRALA